MLINKDNESPIPIPIHKDPYSWLFIHLLTYPFGLSTKGIIKRLGDGKLHAIQS